MSQDILALQPSGLWEHFAELNAVPRASKKEEKVIDFMVKFGKSLGLPTQVDHAGNVIIKKPATPGMESRKTIVLQSHLDMVHQKNSDVDFDFDTEGIKMIYENDWVSAQGTTLGADNGIGVASIMTILSADDIPHPPLEALFTIDEETGMTGALELKGGLLAGEILLNLDTEDDDELTIGCAGGIDVTTTGTYKSIPAERDRIAYSIALKGLSGGHSGMEIHKGLANSNKLMNRILMKISQTLDIGIHSVDGGGLRNAIPRESISTIFVRKEDQEKLTETIDSLRKELIDEYASTDPNLKIQLNRTEAPREVLTPEFQQNILNAIYACPSGIYRMNPDLDNLVQTSNNLARVLIKDGQYEIMCLTRGSVDTEKMDLAQAIRSSFELIGGSVAYSGNYPGWAPKPNTRIVKLMQEIYEELFDASANVYACHAGLECGIIGTNYPDMEMVSFGPNIKGAHSPDERVQVSSVNKYWKFLLETLKRIPAKD